MGCGNSKLQPDGEVIPSRLGPLLRRKLDEIRRRKRASGSGSYSKKELLKDDQEESCLSPSRSTNDHDGNSSSSQEGSLKSLNVKQAKVTPWPECDENVQETVETLKGDYKHGKKHEEGEMVEEVAAAKKDVELSMDATKAAITTSIEMLDESEGEDKKDEDDGERLSCADDRCFCPGSPSFRVYIEDLEIESNNESESQDDSQASKVSNGEESGELTQPKSLNKSKKKGKRGKRFREVIAKGRQASMKNLLNVKSCYSGGCTGHDNARLLPQKAIA